MRTPSTVSGQFRRPLLGKFRFHRPREGDFTLEGVHRHGETAQIRSLNILLLITVVRFMSSITWPALLPAAPAGTEAADQSKANQDTYVLSSFCISQTPLV